MINDYLNAIPRESPVLMTLDALVEECRIVVFSGLPGVGKSLYVNAFQALAQSKEKKVTLIQWDIARKAFETPAIFEHFPMGDGTVHNGVKLIAGKWLMDEVQLWVEEHSEDEEILLIEAPLVGHRFVELVKPQTDEILEHFLSHDGVQVVMPIPSKVVREKIEAERARQVKEDAKEWMGAKPSVMHVLWKMTCGIANEFGKDISMEGQPEYDPEIYEFVFSEILKHRNFVPLWIDEIFSIPETKEDSLHAGDSLKADEKTAQYYCEMVKDIYSHEQIDDIVSKWYLT